MASETIARRAQAEREWFEKEYEKQFCKPVKAEQEGDDKINEVVRKFRKLSQRRVCERKQFYPTVTLPAPSDPVVWQRAPLALKCVCPSGDCTCSCKGNTLLPAEKLPFEIRYNWWGLKELLWKLRMKKYDEPTGTLVPRLVETAKKESLFYRSAEGREILAERGPEFCLSGCLKFFITNRNLDKNFTEVIAQLKAQVKEEELEEEKGDVEIEKSPKTRVLSDRICFQYRCSVSSQAETNADGEFIIGEYSHLLFGNPDENILCDIEGEELHVSSYKEDSSDPCAFLSVTKTVDKIFHVKRIKQRLSEVKKDLITSIFEIPEKYNSKASQYECKDIPEKFQKKDGICESLADIRRKRKERECFKILLEKLVDDTIQQHISQISSSESSTTKPSSICEMSCLNSDDDILNINERKSIPSIETVPKLSNDEKPSELLNKTDALNESQIKNQEQCIDTSVQFKESTLPNLSSRERNTSSDLQKTSLNVISTELCEDLIDKKDANIKNSKGEKGFHKNEGNLQPLDDNLPNKGSNNEGAINTLETSMKLPNVCNGSKQSVNKDEEKIKTLSTPTKLSNSSNGAKTTVSDANVKLQQSKEKELNKTENNTDSDANQNQTYTFDCKKGSPIVLNSDKDLHPAVKSVSSDKKSNLLYVKVIKLPSESDPSTVLLKNEFSLGVDMPDKPSKTKQSNLNNDNLPTKVNKECWKNISYRIDDNEYNNKIAATNSALQIDETLSNIIVRHSKIKSIVELKNVKNTEELEGSALISDTIELKDIALKNASESGNDNHKPQLQPNNNHTESEEKTSNERNNKITNSKESNLFAKKICKNLSKISWKSLLSSHSGNKKPSGSTTQAYKPKENSKTVAFKKSAIALSPFDNATDTEGTNNFDRNVEEKHDAEI